MPRILNSFGKAIIKYLIRLFYNIMKSQSIQKSRYKILSIIIVVIFFILAWPKVKWYQEKKYHKLKQLSLDEFRHFSNIDSSNMDRFIEQILISRMNDNSVEQTKQIIISVLKKLDWEIEFFTTPSSHPNSKNANKSLVNIIATKNPKAPRRLILACHYDSEYFPKFDVWGAADSSIPCSILLQVASSLNIYLNKDHSKFYERISLQIIFFDGIRGFLKDDFMGLTNLAQFWGKREFSLLNESATTDNSDNNIKEEKTNTLQRIDLLILLDFIGLQGFPSVVHFENEKELRWTFLGADLYLNESKNRWNNSPFDKKTKKIKYRSKIPLSHIPILNRQVDIIHVSTSNRVDETKELDIDGMDLKISDTMVRIFKVYIAKYLHLSI